MPVPKFVPVPEFVNGHSIDEAAREMGITEASARTYLQHVYEKVGVNRRQKNKGPTAN